MYQALLTRRYLTSKIMPLLAAVAVTLCTSMVIVVWSVMGGFLSSLISSGRSLVGDVIIEWPNAGFPYYEELLADLRQDPMVEAAAPSIQTWSLVVMPDGRREMMIVRGIEGESFARVTNYAESLWWRPVKEPLPKDEKREDIRLAPEVAPTLEQILKNGLSLTRPNPETGQLEAAAVPGIEATGLNGRSDKGFYTPRMLNRRMPDGSVEAESVFMPRNGRLTLTLAPIDSKGSIVEPVQASIPVANEFKSGLFQIDRQTVLVELNELQRLLRMDKASRVAEGSAESRRVTTLADDGQEQFAPIESAGEEPARITTIFVRGRGDAGDAEALSKRVEELYEKFADRHSGEVPEAWSIQIRTWREQNAQMIGAVEKEIGLVLILFSFISMTAVFLVLAIFWSMVAEKTKDIGILRALGASRSGVAWLWVRYGLGIGVVGSLGGLAVSFLVVTNINEIHEWIGRTFNTWVWDPRIYYFTEIPATYKWLDAAIVAGAGVLSSGVGALLPAFRAARLDPVRALRFE